jgi:lipopolysaccharide biosynthesis glycosyltransferase
VTAPAPGRARHRPPLVCGVDERYTRPLCATMASIAEAHPRIADRPRLIVLHQRLAAAAQQRILGHADRIGLTVELRTVPPPAGRYPVSGWVSDAVYLRLSIAEAIPEEPVALYLDADTMVLDDFGPLLETNLDGALLAAVRDPQNPLIGRGIALPGWESLGLPAGREYFNSGVMLLDLVSCRRAGLFEKARAFLLDHPDSVRFWDQDALNWAADDAWMRLGRRWNTFALSPLAARAGFIHHAESVIPLRTLLAEEETAAVLHFAGPDKPWHDGYPAGSIRDAYRRFLAPVGNGIRR